MGDASDDGEHEDDGLIGDSDDEDEEDDELDVLILAWRWFMPYWPLDDAIIIIFLQSIHNRIYLKVVNNATKKKSQL